MWFHYHEIIFNFTFYLNNFLFKLFLKQLSILGNFYKLRSKSKSLTFYKYALKLKEEIHRRDIHMYKNLEKLFLLFYVKNLKLIKVFSEIT